MQGHLLIGPPSSGKTTFAKLLSPIINAEVISTDSIREEIYGNSKKQGEWSEIKLVIEKNIFKYLNQKKFFIFDATNCKRSWRLEITQNSNFSEKVDWIGWWLKTPLEKCIEWNKRRDNIVENKIIENLYYCLNQPHFSPSNIEGFKVVKLIDPSKEIINENFIQNEIKSISKSIIQSRRKYPKVEELHDYSNLIDFERLIYLIKYLSQHPYDIESRNLLLKNSTNFIKEKFGDCYADYQKINLDLNWLEQNHFFHGGENRPIKVDFSNTKIINSGGWPYTARKERFLQTMHLLRHILQNPFDYSEFDENIYVLLTKRLSITHTLKEDRKVKEDCEKILRPYFLKEKNTKHKRGYCIGNSLLNKSQLKDLCLYLDQASKKLGDTNAQTLHSILSKRLQLGGILTEDINPIRIFANHSIIDKGSTNIYSLASDIKNGKNKKIIFGINELEESITNGNRIVIERFKSASKFSDSRSGEIYPIWPLQLIFNNIAWYLAYEDYKGSVADFGLIEVERLDRIAIKSIEINNIRNSLKRKKTFEMLNKFMEISGGIYFGTDLNIQKKIFNSSQKNIDLDLFVKVRFLASEKIYKFLREGLQRYPSNQIRISKPLKEDNWSVTNKKVFILNPDAKNEYPFPIEIYLPPWTVEKDIDFQRWLFGFGSEIKIESPISLKAKHIQFAQDIKSSYK